MTPVPPAATRYLRQVTVLLPPAPARRVRAELHGHLHQSMLDARVRGLGEADAWATALQEVGPVLPAALRLAREHTLGHVLRGLLVVGALGGAAHGLQGTHPSQASALQAQP